MKKAKKAKKSKKVKKYAPKKLAAKKIGGMALDQAYFLLGCLSFAASVNMFALPNKIAQSGFSGMAVILHTLFDFLPVGAVNFALNIPLLALALIFFGWRFTSKTLWVTAELSLAIDLMARFVSWEYSGDRLLAAVLCGALRGFGTALIFMRDATGGGSDIVGWLVRRRWPAISLGRVILAAEVAVVAASAAVFREVESALYAAIMLFINSRVIDTMVSGMNNGKMFYIFSQKAEEISKTVIEQIGRGATILQGKGAFTGTRREVLLCVVHRNEVAHLRRVVKEHDPGSFIVMAEAQEVLGKGFDERERIKQSPKRKERKT